ncbi:unnamed protein product [Somion occarium]|uniref:Uncharacterized protein n=1 Tax=Somion occarium TaxID=3059160 RepID=A0ABP1D1L3_9APHY
MRHSAVEELDLALQLDALTLSPNPDLEVPNPDFVRMLRKTQAIYTLHEFTAVLYRFDYRKIYIPLSVDLRHTLSHLEIDMAKYHASKEAESRWTTFRTVGPISTPSCDVSQNPLSSSQ